MNEKTGEGTMRNDVVTDAVSTMPGVFLPCLASWPCTFGMGLASLIDVMIIVLMHANIRFSWLPIVSVPSSHGIDRAGICRNRLPSRAKDANLKFC